MPARPDPLRAAFLVCDIVGATTLADRVGDEAWLDLLIGHRALVRAEAEPRGGEEVAFRAGGSILAFAGGTDTAAQCAIAIQRAVVRLDDGYAVRIGLHTGSALRHERTVIGRAVNHACRLADAAQPGEILVSPLAAGEAGARTEPATVPFGSAAGRLPARRLAWDPQTLHASRRFRRADASRDACA
ncbi:MAG: adenylate/guanylate cyclase domain-containing protein [Solirubrobacteraceae bacterium]